MKRFWSAAMAAVVVAGCSVSGMDSGEPCGVVSVFSNPPQTQDLYQVTIARVDQRTVVKHHSIQLAPGKHVIKLNDQITDPRLTVKGRYRDAQEFEIEVEANKKYHLAARFFPDKRYTNRGDYWAPEIWKVTDHSCTL